MAGFFPTALPHLNPDLVGGAQADTLGGPGSKDGKDWPSIHKVTVRVLDGPVSPSNQDDTPDGKLSTNEGGSSGMSDTGMVVRFFRPGPLDISTGSEDYDGDADGDDLEDDQNKFQKAVTRSITKSTCCPTDFAAEDDTPMKRGSDYGDTESVCSPAGSEMLPGWFMDNSPSSSPISTHSRPRSGNLGFQVTPHQRPAAILEGPESSDEGDTAAKAAVAAAVAVTEEDNDTSDGEQLGEATALAPRAPPGLSEMDAVQGAPSRGSAEHGVGACSPCAWVWKPQGCLRGRDCGYCHLCPEGEIKARKKAKQAAARATAPGGQLSEAGDDLPQGFGDDAQDDDDEELLQKEQVLDLVCDVQQEPSAAKADDDGLPSIGSDLHAAGVCRPCAWFWKAQGCQNGKDCRHCHLCPEGEIKARKKVKVDAMRQEKQLPDQANSQDSFDSSDEEQLGSEQAARSARSGSEGTRSTEVPRPSSPQRSLPKLPGSPASSPKTSTGPGSPGGLGSSPGGSAMGGSAMGGSPSSGGGGSAIPPPPGLPPPPTPSAGALRSVGSALHGTGQCRPCAWLWKPEGCHNGEECRHCHLCPEGEIKARRRQKLGSTPTAASVKEKSSADASQDDQAGSLLSAAGRSNSSKIELFPHIAFPTPGSALHGTGACRPCAWFWKAQGCENGSDCRHCHLCPEGEIKQRRKSKVTTVRPHPSDEPITLPIPQSQEPARITLSITEQLFYAPTMPVKLDLATSLAPPPLASPLHGFAPSPWFPQGHACPAGDLQMRTRAKDAPPHGGAPALQTNGGNLDPSSPRIVQIAPILGA